MSGNLFESFCFSVLSTAKLDFFKVVDQISANKGDDEMLL